MKISIIGAAGLRTPLIIQSMLSRLDRLDLKELCLMDIDAERLELVGALTQQLEESNSFKVSITRTTDARVAFVNSDFVITTFRVGGMESRAIDERVPLNHGILGQETTGPGGFAMGIRSIPVIIDYIHEMEQFCPNAWLINFANPAGMLTEAVVRSTNWSRIVGICDAPTSMHKVISGLLKEKPESVYIDYIGLNHLGWIKGIISHNRDYLPSLIEMCRNTGFIPGLPFDADLIRNLGMIPNEYLYYYYYATQSVKNILGSGESRGEHITRLNTDFFCELRQKYGSGDIPGMHNIYNKYLQTRGETYMRAETGKQHDLSSLDSNIIESIVEEGYAGVALDLIEALISEKSIVQILNVANRGAIRELNSEDVVEIPTLVSKDHLQPLAVTDIPSQCIGLIQQVKQYEQLTIEAAIKGSYDKALLALTIHPLVQDFTLAKIILDEYIIKHKGYFPNLT